MTKYTNEQIDSMSAGQLRKAVKDAGFDPMKYDKGNPVELRKLLKLHHKTASKAAPTKPAPKPVAAPARGAAAPARPVAARPAVKTAAPAAKAAPAKPAVKPAAAPAKPAAAKPVAAKPVAAAKPGFKVETAAAGKGATAHVITPPPATAAKASAEDKAWKEQVELRLATLESQLGVASTTSAPAPVSDLSSLEQFLVEDEATGEMVHALDISDVATLSEEQLLACGQLLGTPFKAGTPVRTLRAKVTEGLQKLSGVVEEPPAAEEEAAPEAEGEEVAEEAPAEDDGTYPVGSVVVAVYDGQEYDPCRIEKVFKNKDGSVKGYDVFFAADASIAEVAADGILGYSDQPIE